MQKDVALKLNELNARFYARACDSFSETRQSPWPGWERVFQLAEQQFGLAAGNESGASAQSADALRVLDLACGNLRFERALVQRYGTASLDLCALDCCDALLPEDSPIAYRHLDIVSELLEGNGLQALDDWPPFGLVCSFGFMHHVPGFENRLAFLQEMAKRSRRGSLVAVSFWRFMANEKLAAKAQETTARALKLLAEEGLSQNDLEENDFLIGWQDEPDLFRYCHHFDEDELDRLVDALQDSMRPVARFKADGRTEDLNHYLVFEVKE